MFSLHFKNIYITHVFNVNITDLELMDFIVPMNHKLNIRISRFVCSFSFRLVVLLSMKCCFVLSFYVIKPFPSAVEGLSFVIVAFPGCLHMYVYLVCE